MSENVSVKCLEMLENVRICWKILENGKGEKMENFHVFGSFKYEECSLFSVLWSGKGCNM